MNSRPRLRLVTFPLLAVSALSLSLNCGKGTSGLVQNSEAKSPSGWSIKVIEASQPGTVKLKARSVFGGTEPEKSTSPPANQSWLLVKAELTPPGAATPLLAKNVKLVDANGSYPALAMSAVPEKSDPSFVYFKDSSGLAQINASGQLLWAIMNNRSTGDPEIIFQKDGGEKVLFLFAVPAAAKGLSLQIS